MNNALYELNKTNRTRNDMKTMEDLYNEIQGNDELKKEFATSLDNVAGG